jgi:hypothetical protein
LLREITVKLYAHNMIFRHVVILKDGLELQ